MMNVFKFGCLLLVLWWSGQAGAQVLHDAGATADTEALEEIVVTGSHAGPRMWQVTNGDHVLWILGVLDPLPDMLEWDSREVEAVLGESQAVILDGMSVKADASLFGKIGLYLRWRKLQKLADGRQLRDVLPADVYARFTTLKQRYAPRDDDLESLRPMLAAAGLYQAAVKKIGLGERRVVNDKVIKLAKRRDIKPYTVSITVTDPRQLLDSLASIANESELSCFTATLATLESDVERLRLRANAWSLGNVEQLRAVLESQNRTACWDVLNTVPRVRELATGAQARWVDAAERSLLQYRSTLALRAIRDVLAADGVIAELRARGYQVIGR